MDLKNIILFIIIIVFLFSYLTDMYSKMEKNKLKNEFIIKEDNNDMYMNPYLTQTEIVPNVIKKYNDNKINVLNFYNSQNKNIYDSTVQSSLNNNMNKNNLLHFINFLI